MDRHPQEETPKSASDRTLRMKHRACEVTGLEQNETGLETVLVKLQGSAMDTGLVKLTQGL